MFYNFRFATAVRDICCWQNGALRDAALGLPVTTEQLAETLARQKPVVWQSRGLSPRQAAIMTIVGVLAKRRDNPVVAGFAPFLSLALTSHSVRHPEDARLIVSVLGLDEFDDDLVEAVMDHDGWDRRTGAAKAGGHHPRRSRERAQMNSATITTTARTTA